VLFIVRNRTTAGYQVVEGPPKTAAGTRAIALDKHTFYDPGPLGGVCWNSSRNPVRRPDIRATAERPQDPFGPPWGTPWCLAGLRCC